MIIVPLPRDESAVRRYVEELWVPYNRELERIVASFELSMRGAALVDAETAFRRDRLDEDAYEMWVAVEGVPDGDVAVGAGEGTLAGFVTTEVEEAPPVFARPDRLVVGDIYVCERHRGAGLAAELLERAAERARTAGCEEVALDVDVDNERAAAFYEKAGFEVRRRRLVAGADDI